ncbi:glycine betaine ABC transporter substrate-binding protein [Halomarina salina]|uniref:Glycine betaine ABC transporter substrate-binding protein n=1 Tax=Halomarina salina TaxID=1872699 RepID=A0ABD5RHW5_9EURY
MERTRRDFLKLGGATAATAGVGATAGCTGAFGAVAGDSVTVSSMRFTEDVVLGYLSIESLKANTDLTVLDETGLGGTTLNLRAVSNGEVDLFWYYSGGAWLNAPPKKDEVIPDAKKLYQAVEGKLAKHYDTAYLNRAPFNNTYAIAVTPEWSKKTGVKTLSDFAAYVKKQGGNLTGVLGPEFLNRPDGWPGLVKSYDFQGAASNLELRSISAALCYQIIAETDADFGMVFTTNPKVKKYDLVTLEDDRDFFPIYNPAPAVNQGTLDALPSIREPLNAIGPTLNTEKIMRLNERVALDGEDAQAVARDYLESEGLV